MMTDLRKEDFSGEDIKTKDYYVRLRGLPFSAKEPEIRTFFDGKFPYLLNIWIHVLLLGLVVDDVQLISTPDGRPSGEAFVGFSSINDADQAMLRDKNKLGTRYVEGCPLLLIIHMCKNMFFSVFRVTEPEFARIRNGGTYGSQNHPTSGFSGSRHSNGVIRVRGLPYSCKQHELINFFQGLSRTRMS